MTQVFDTATELVRIVNTQARNLTLCYVMAV